MIDIMIYACCKATMVRMIAGHWLHDFVCLHPSSKAKYQKLHVTYFLVTESFITRLFGFCPTPSPARNRSSEEYLVAGNIFYSFLAYTSDIITYLKINKVKYNFFLIRSKRSFENFLGSFREMNEIPIFL